MIKKSSIPFPLIKLVERFRGRGFALSNRFPLYNPESDLSPFFIVGCGRSGNTLLRSMLVANNQLVIPPESYVIPRVVRKFIALGYLPWNELASIIISEFETFEEFHTWNVSLSPVYKKAKELEPEHQNLANVIDLIYKEYGLSVNKTNVRWGDKTPKNSEFLEHICSTFPGAQYIHLIRDPRAVFASYKKADLKTRTDMKDKKNIVNFWLDCHRHIQHCKKTQGDGAFTVVHYEDLIQSPELNLKTVSNFLGISYSHEMISRSNTTELGDVRNDNHHANVLNPISPSSISKWKHELTAEEIDYVEKHCMKYYKKLCAMYPPNTTIDLLT